MGGRLSKRKHEQRGEDNNVGALAGDPPDPAAPAAPAPKKQRLLRSNDTFSRADMTTFDDLPRDIQLRIFREALFDDYAACVRGPSLSGSSCGSWPKSLWVPELPIPVEPLTWDDDQVPFDPVPPGVTEGLRAAKAAGRISTVSRSFMSLARDASMWKAVLDAAEVACEPEEEDRPEEVSPHGTSWFESTSFKIKTTDFELNLTDEDVRGLTQKYSQPCLDEKWLTLSTFNRCRKMLIFIEMIYEDFYEQCHDYNACVTFAYCVLTNIAEYILDPEENFMRYEMVRRTDKEPGEVTLLNTEADPAGDRHFEVFECLNFRSFELPTFDFILSNQSLTGCCQLHTKRCRKSGMS